MVWASVAHSWRCVARERAALMSRAIRWVLVFLVGSRLPSRSFISLW